jgi:hypothetical protein
MSGTCLKQVVEAGDVLKGVREHDQIERAGSPHRIIRRKRYAVFGRKKAPKRFRDIAAEQPGSRIAVPKRAQ